MDDVREYNKQYRDANKDKIAENQKKYREKHKEELAQKDHERYLRNKNKIYSNMTDEDIVALMSKRAKRRIADMYASGETAENIAHTLALPFYAVALAIEISEEVNAVRLAQHGEAIKNDYFSGMTMQEIAEKYWIFSPYLREYISEIRAAAIFCDLVVSGAKMSEICEQYEITESTVRKYASKHLAKLIADSKSC